MVWRGLAELQRRAIDGMPRPDPKVMERRRVRKVRDAAIDAFSTIDGSTPH